MAQHNTTQHSRAQNNTTQHNTTQHNTTQHNTTQHNTTQHNTTQHNKTLHNTNNTTQRNTTQRNATQHNTTQHNITQHNTTQHNTMKTNPRSKQKEKAFKLQILNIIQYINWWYYENMVDCTLMFLWLRWAHVYIRTCQSNICLATGKSNQRQINWLCRVLLVWFPQWPGIFSSLSVVDINSEKHHK